jgi:hypothetical protein
LLELYLDKLQTYEVEKEHHCQTHSQ